MLSSGSSHGDQGPGNLPFLFTALDFAALVLHLPLDGDARDASPAQRHGVAFNARYDAAVSVAGGGALYLDGAGHVTLPDGVTWGSAATQQYPGQVGFKRRPKIFIVQSGHRKCELRVFFACRCRVVINVFRGVAVVHDAARDAAP